MILKTSNIASTYFKDRTILLAEVRYNVCGVDFEERSGNAERRLKQTQHACSKKCAAHFRKKGGESYLKKNKHTLRSTELKT